jgi:hypothetical protein
MFNYDLAVFDIEVWKTIEGRAASSSNREQVISCGALKVDQPLCYPKSNAVLLDAFRLRKEYRMTGKLIGAQVLQVKKSGPENVVKGLVGLPFVLSQFEVEIGLVEDFLEVYVEDIKSWTVTETQREIENAERIHQIGANADVTRRDNLTQSTEYFLSYCLPI